MIFGPLLTENSQAQSSVLLRLADSSARVVWLDGSTLTASIADTPADDCEETFRS